MSTQDRAILYANPKHIKGSRTPNYVGVAIINGINKNVSAWVKNDKNGKECISIAFSDEVKIIKEKIIPVKTTNKSGKRALDQIGVGTLDTKNKIINIDAENLPF